MPLQNQGKRTICMIMYKDVEKVHPVPGKIRVSSYITAPPGVFRSFGSNTVVPGGIFNILYIKKYNIEMDNSGAIC